MTVRASESFAATRARQASQRRWQVSVVGQVIFVGAYFYIAFGLWASARGQLDKLQRLNLATTAVVKRAAPHTTLDSMVSVGYILQVAFVLPNGTPVRTSVDPKMDWRSGCDQSTDECLVKVRYDERDPVFAAYDGTGGDYKAGSSLPSFLCAGVLLAIDLLVAGACIAQWSSIFTAARSPRRPASVKELPGRTLRASFADGPDLEWRIHKFQPVPRGNVRVAEHWRWVVAEVDGRLIWPLQRAEPILGTSRPPAPTFSEFRPEAIAPHRRLLWAYTQAATEAAALPFCVRRPPRPNPKTMSRWTFGAPGALVACLVKSHIRRSLIRLDQETIRKAMLVSRPGEEQVRKALCDSSDEINALAQTLSGRAGWRRAGSILISFVLATIGAVTPFVDAPHLGKGVVSVGVGLVVLGVIFALPLVSGAVFGIFRRAFQVKHELFRPTPAGGVPGFDVYELEREAFASVDATPPREWESRPLIAALVAFAWGAAIFVLFLIGKGFIAAIIALLMFFAILAILTLAARHQHRMHTLLAGPTDRI